MKTIPRSSILVLEIIFWFKQDANGEGWVGGWGGSRDVHIIIGGVFYLMMMLDYKGERGVKNLRKSDYVICRL